MKSINDQSLIEGIRERKIDFSVLYDKYYKYVKNAFIKKGASIDEINDIYQESMIVVYNKILSPEFVLTAKLSTYLYGIAQNLWLKELEKRSKFVNANTSFLVDDEENSNSYNSMISKIMIHEDVYDEDEIKVALIKNMIDKLPCRERRIIDLFLSGMDNEEMRVEMEFANKDVVKTLKSRALRMLRIQIEELKNIAPKELTIFNIPRKDENEMEKLFNINPLKFKSSYATSYDIEVVETETIEKEIVFEKKIEIEESFFEEERDEHIETLTKLPNTIVVEDKKKDSKFNTFLSFFNKLLR